MKRFFIIIKITEYIIYLFIVLCFWNALKSLVIIANTLSNVELIGSFLVNIILAVVCSFMVFFSKKYLYNFFYFEIDEEIKIEDNLTLDFPKFTNYEEVPEPKKILIPILIILLFVSFCVVIYLLPLFLSFFSYNGFEYFGFVEGVYGALRSIPLFYYSILPSQALLIYSFTMYFQVKHYTKYYNSLIKYNQEVIDLSDEILEH